MSRVLAAVATVAIVVSSFAFTSNVALGHERRAVGPYTFVVGWINEPSYVNLLNSLDLTVTETSGGKVVVVERVVNRISGELGHLQRQQHA